MFNSTLASALPANAMSHIAPAFGIETTQGNPQLVLPISIYLVGYVFGPLLFGPLSELYGRRPIMQLTFAGYTLFTMGCALAPNWAALITFRFFAGTFAAAPLTVVGGMLADIYNEPATRGRSIACFMAAIIVAPLLAPIISGFIAEVAWRWVFWTCLLIAGASGLLLAFLPETYGPRILVQLAAELRHEAKSSEKDVSHIYAPLEVEHKDWRHVFTVVLARPFRMMATELIVLSTCLYLAVAYGIFYMYFQAYPIVFRGIYGMSIGISGLMFLPIGLGTGIGLAVSMVWDSRLQRSLKAGRTWAQKEEYRRLPLACLGGPLYAVALFWLGWTARAEISWVVPFLAGVPFGMGIFLIFIALLNYLGDSYKIYSASAMAAAACCRSILGALLPLATNSMYTNLGVGWATSLLAFLSLGMCAVPFLFLRYGDFIRERSVFCQSLKHVA